MAPARDSIGLHRGIIEPSSSLPPSSNDDLSELFLDPMLGTPLAMYVEKDVQERDVIIGLITVGRVAYFLEPLITILHLEAWRKRRSWVQRSAIHTRYTQSFVLSHILTISNS